MELIAHETPFLIKISFSKLIKTYENISWEGDAFKQGRRQKLLDIAKQHPILVDGFNNLEVLNTYEKEIHFILEDCFSSLLGSNEIKAASIPFGDFFFNSSERFKKIIADAGEHFKPSIRNFEEGHLYIMACSVILAKHYGVDVGFRRPLFYDIPDKNGVMRNYRILYNADFTELTPTPKAKGLSPEDIELLLDNFDNVALWKEKIPPSSWEVKGFVIANIFDATTDESISALKTSLLNLKKRQSENFIGQFQTIFQSFFGSKHIKIGFSIFNNDENCLESVNGRGIVSYLLNGKTQADIHTSLCQNAMEALTVKRNFFAIADVDKHAEIENNAEFKIFKDQGIKSAILAPIATENEVIGVLEIISTEKGLLNSVSAYKLVDVMPYIVTSVKRAKEEEANLIEALIQQECTAIHHSVYWSFEKEAKRVLKEKLAGNEAVFKELVFKDVVPLYGQVDIKDSSKARNEAIQRDLIIQLSQVNEIIAQANKQKKLPIFEELLFRANNFILKIKDNFETDSEQTILDFLKEDIHPVLPHIKETQPELAVLVDEYFDALDPVTLNLYDHRKNYDQTVTKINKTLAGIIDAAQVDAQTMYPHYFERYKTDGVEHNMYIGASLNRQGFYNPLYLYNLRLWQLQVVCDMENAYYNLLPELPVKLDVTSLILVHSSPMAIRFRMDEKRFDVDGTYNARYEILKKRLDKALVKGSGERITQKGKVAIVYSLKKEEREYMRYIKFLQSKKILSENVEQLELEGLQGVSGLKALRVEVLFTKKGGKKEFYTYQDLMEELSS